MANTSWHVSGKHVATCNCDFVCPCIPSNMTAQPTHGQCDVGYAFHIERGHFGDTNLDNLSFILVVHTPGAMAEGNWTVGLIVDERADSAQTDALTAIANGSSGGPMAALSPFFAEFKGVEKRPIHFEDNGGKHSVSVPGEIEQMIEVVPSTVAQGEPVYITNTSLPVSSQVAVARAPESHIHAFGIEWDGTDGTTYGHYAPFDWSA